MGLRGDSPEPVPLEREWLEGLRPEDQDEAMGQSDDWPSCAECGDTGLMYALAPCTTFDRECACNGPRVEVPCEFCEAGKQQAERHGALWGEAA